MSALLKSCVCGQAQLESETFRTWSQRMAAGAGPWKLHRKLWEWCYIAQALHERGMLRPGRRGLGFAVGREPLAALFASYGCDIVATDLDESSARASGWEGNQHAANLEALNQAGLCPDGAFRQRVTFRPADMNRIPADLREFDFVWSSCAFEHLGSIRLGKRFIREMTRCLRPGGVAVHTTEFNCSSNFFTRNHCHDVIYRRRDLQAMARWLRRRGHHIDLDFTLGDKEADQFVDRPPYCHNPHLKLQLGRFVTTSLGLIIEMNGLRAEEPVSWLRRLAASLARLWPGQKRAPAFMGGARGPSSWYPQVGPRPGLGRERPGRSRPPRPPHAAPSS